jgi:hypothetical protein
MSVECWVLLPNQEVADVYKFLTVPRIGEGVRLHGHDNGFLVESVEHGTRKPGHIDQPTVMMRLRALPIGEI